MSDPIRFLVSFGQAVSTMALYNDGHPARERAVDRSYQCLRDLQADDQHPRFSFLGEETIYQDTALRELGDWEWGTRLAQAGVQRMEFENDVTREQYEEFLEEMMARITLSFIDSAEARPNRPTGIKIGALGIRGETREIQESLDANVPVATISYSLGEEIESIQSMHRDVLERGKLPLAEAEAVAHEHHIMINGHGYPTRHYPRDCHKASNLVHVCDVYDALRTRRPYRDSWESERALAYIGERTGTEFEPAAAGAFVQMMRK